MKKDTSKIERILKLILYLDVSFPRKKDECVEYLEISDSTFYEYIKLLRYSGFDIQQKDGNYWLDVLNSENTLLANLLHFNEEEAYLITKAIKHLDVSLPVAARLYRKLLQLFDNDELLSKVVRKTNSEVVSKLESAIREKKCVLLVNYASSNSSTIKNRYVEPFEFKHEFNLVWAYDLKEQTCKQFKISRIEDVEIAPIAWKYHAEHKCLPIDVFRNAGELHYPVQLQLSLRAYNLLIEEYPLAEKYCQELEAGVYQLKTSIAKLEGAARFIMGLADEVELIGGNELIEFLKQKSKNIQIKF